MRLHMLLLVLWRRVWGLRLRWVVIHMLCVLLLLVLLHTMHTIVLHVGCHCWWCGKFRRAVPLTAASHCTLQGTIVQGDT
jgi:hypothetical protein